MKNKEILSLYIVFTLISCSLNSSQLGRSFAFPESENRTSVSTLNRVQDTPICFSHSSICLNTKAWMQNSGAWGKCQDGEEIDNLVTSIDELPIEKRSNVLGLLETSGAILKCQTGKEVAFLIDEMRLRTDQALLTLHWIQESRAAHKCKTGREFARLIDLIVMSGADEIRLLQILTQIKSSGALEKCQDWREIGRLFYALDGLSRNKGYSRILSQIKNSGAWMKCQNGEELRGFLFLFGNLERSFDVLKEEVIKTCLVDYGYLSLLLRWHRDQGNEYAIKILYKERYIDADDFKKHWNLYILCHAFYASNEKIKEATQRMLLNTPDSEEILRKIGQLLGENHRFTKWCFGQRQVKVQG